MKITACSWIIITSFWNYIYLHPVHDHLFKYQLFLPPMYSTLPKTVNTTTDGDVEMYSKANKKILVRTVELWRLYTCFAKRKVNKNLIIIYQLNWRLNEKNNLFFKCVFQLFLCIFIFFLSRYFCKHDYVRIKICNLLDDVFG
jgi:hypothetical protein